MPRKPREQPAKPQVADAPKPEPQPDTEPAAPPRDRRPQQARQSSREGVVVEGRVPVLELYKPDPIEAAALDKLNVYQRWNSMIGEMGIVPKRGWNAHHEYWFTTDADLNAYVGPLLSKYHLVVLPTLETDKIQRFDTAGKQFVTRVPMLIKVLNADRPEEFFEIEWAGEGGDTVDKGLYKAFTGGLKYFYMKTLQVATGDDPEVFQRTDALADQAAQAQAVQTAQGGGQQQRPPQVTQSNRQQPGKGGRQQGVTEVQIRQVKAMSHALNLGPRGTAELIDRVLSTGMFDAIDGIDNDDEQARVLVELIKGQTGENIGRVLYQMGQDQAARARGQEEQPDQQPGPDESTPPTGSGDPVNSAPEGYEPV